MQVIFIPQGDNVWYKDEVTLHS